MSKRTGKPSLSLSILCACAFISICIFRFRLYLPLSLQPHPIHLHHLCHPSFVNSLDWKRSLQPSSDIYLRHTLSRPNKNAILLKSRKQKRMFTETKYWCRVTCVLRTRSQGGGGRMSGGWWRLLTGLFLEKVGLRDWLRNC